MRFLETKETPLSNVKFSSHEEEITELNNPSIGLSIGPYVWREMFDFTEGSVLLVLASEYYDEDDYVRNYEVSICNYHWIKILLN